MEFFKKRQNAFAILAAVIVVFTLLGVHLSLNREVAKLDKMFTAGVSIEKESYIQPGIETHLQSRIKASLGLLTIAANYDGLSDETEALSNARHALVGAVSIKQKYEANQKLEAAYMALASSLAAQDVTDGDLKAVATYVSNLSGAQKAIEVSAYNTKVTEYETGILGAFPVSILRGLAFPDSPEYFGAVA